MNRKNPKRALKLRQDLFFETQGGAALSFALISDIITLMRGKRTLGQHRINGKVLGSDFSQIFLRYVSEKLRLFGYVITPSLRSRRHNGGAYRRC